MSKRKTCQPITWRNMLDDICTQDKSVVATVTSTGIPSYVSGIIMEYVAFNDEVDWAKFAHEENVKDFVTKHPKKFLGPLEHYEIPFQWGRPINAWATLAKAIAERTGYSSGWRELAIRLFTNPRRVDSIEEREMEIKGRKIRKKNRATDIKQFLTTMAVGDIVKTIYNEHKYSSTYHHTHYKIVKISKNGKIVTHAIRSGREVVFGVKVEKIDCMTQECSVNFEHTNTPLVIDYEVRYDQSGYWSGPGHGQFADPIYIPKQDVSINGTNMKDTTTCIPPQYWSKME